MRRSQVTIRRYDTYPARFRRWRHERHWRGRCHWWVDEAGAFCMEHANECGPRAG